MSAFADNEFTTDEVNRKVSEKTRVEFERMVGLYRFIGWRVRVEGSLLLISSGGGAVSSQYQVGDDLDSIRAYLMEHYTQHAVKHSPPHFLQ